MRLKTARWMVVNTDRSVAQIAYECGFTDSSHLIRWFKKSFGNTPTKMRAIHGVIGNR
jgi:transcriptional regulator GlxA family with amidase domain